MILKKTLLIAALSAALPAIPAFAEETGDIAPEPPPQATSEEADEQITVLDQTVPVAEDEEEAAGPPEEEAYDLNDRELLIAEFERFKELQAAGVYDQALNVAKRVVEMSITQTGPTSNDTARSLSNLGLVQHRLQEYEAAQQNFRSAIDIITDNEDKLSSMLVNPLKGLGASQLASGRPDLASQTYAQAVHISHVNEGPHNLDQIEILEALAETNLRMGEIDDAKNNQDMIYALNLRHYSGDATELIEPLMRRASWQHRTGYILDERATYRRIIRIIESEKSKDDISLIDPLTQLGQSYFFVDTSESGSFQSGSVASGELYFKRAVRIAENSPESDWQTLARARLALGDYYNFRGDQGRARRTYRDAWDLLSEDDERLGERRSRLEELTALNADSVPKYLGSATKKDRTAANSTIREGRIVVSYNVSSRGRVNSLQIVEEEPVDFEDMRRTVVRELRTRIFRPRHVDGEPVETSNLVFSHTYYYLQEELEKVREDATDEET